MRLLLSVTFLLLACGPTSRPNDGGVDAGVDGGSDAGSMACLEPYRTCQQPFTFRALDEQSVTLRGNFAPDGWTVGVPMTKQGGQWVASVSVPWGGAVQYKFLVNNAIWVTDPANPALLDGNSVVTNLTCTTWTCAADAPDPAAFDWRDAVIYFVFVDRFVDGDPTTNCHVPNVDPAGQYQGGDWKGVTSRITDGTFTRLGVNTLWVTVPVTNASVGGSGGDGHLYSGYHGYWPSDLESVESCFGSKQDLVDLVSAAHQHGLKVLFDFAMVHVHQSAAVFAQHPDWFWPLSYNGGTCVCDDQGVCPWATTAQRCWFADYLPHWNYTVAAARDYSVDRALKLLVDANADGFRLDAIKHVDDSWLTQLRSRLTTEVLPTRAPRPRLYLVGETFEFGNRDFIKSFLGDERLDGQFDFPLRLALLQSVVMRQTPMSSLKSFVDGNDDFYGPRAVMSTWVGNHDLPRVIHFAEDTPMWSDPYTNGKDRSWLNQPQLPNYRRPFERLANAFAFLFTSRGAPLIYYGDEIGLPGAGDPDNRRMMQWTGLTADQQWLEDRISKLAAIRAAHPALRRGVRATLSVSDDTWAYSMTTEGDVVWVAINRGDADLPVSGLPAGTFTEALSGQSVTGPQVTVPARSTLVLTR